MFLIGTWGVCRHEMKKGCMDHGGSPMVPLVLGRIRAVDWVRDICVKYPGHVQSIVDQQRRLSLESWK